jgi:hypothetical protein
MKKIQILLATLIMLSGVSITVHANTLYVTDGDSSRLAIVDTDTGILLNTTTTHTLGYPIAIRDTIWIGYYGTGDHTVFEYDLAGTPTGNSSSVTSLRGTDGAVNGNVTYTLAPAFNATANVYQCDSNFGNPVSLFTVPGTDLVGITFDTVGGNLWISDSITIYQYNLSGTLISSFAHAGSRGCLAYDPTTDTLWYVSNNSNEIRQYSKAGSLMQTMTVTGLSANNWGAEFASGPYTPPATASIPTINEWGMIIMSLMLAGTAFLMMRRRQMY